MARLIIILIITAALVTGLVYIFWGDNFKPLPDKEDLQENSNLLQENALPPGSQMPTEGVPESIKKSMIQPPQSIDLEEGIVYMAKLKTSEGEILIELNTEQTPVTAYNFIYLARQKFYDDTIFHRVIKNFMIQGGDPEGTGMGGPGYKFADEPFEGEYTRGTIAMANSGPNTNGSQFFIMHKDYPLPPNYVIFGHVAKGIEVVDKIAEAEMQPGGEGSKPVNPVRVESVEIIEVTEE